MKEKHSRIKDWVKKYLIVEMFHIKLTFKWAVLTKTQGNYSARGLAKQNLWEKKFSIIQILVLILDELSWFWVIEYVANRSPNKLIFNLLLNLNFERCFLIVPLWPTFSKQSIMNPFHLKCDWWICHLLPSFLPFFFSFHSFI